MHCAAVASPSLPLTICQCLASRALMVRGGQAPENMRPSFIELAALSRSQPICQWPLAPAGESSPCGGRNEALLPTGKRTPGSHRWTELAEHRLRLWVPRYGLALGVHPVAPPW